MFQKKKKKGFFQEKNDYLIDLVWRKDNSLKYDKFLTQALSSITY